MQRAIIKHIHPYSRVYCVVILVLAAALAGSHERLIPIGAVIIVLAAISGIRLRLLLFGLIPIASLVAGIFLLSLLSGMSVGSVRLEPIVMFISRCYLAFLIIAALLATTDPVDVIQAFEVLRVPMLLTAVAGSIFRWFHLLRRESQKMNTARVLRGGDLNGRIAQFKGITNLSTSLMVRSYLRAERVAEAMECRGFHGRLQRSITRKLQVSDFVAVVILCILIAIVWVVTS